MANQGAKKRLEQNRKKLQLLYQIILVANVGTRRVAVTVYRGFS